MAKLPPIRKLPPTRGRGGPFPSALDLFPVPVPGRGRGSSPVTVGDAAPNSAGLETSHDQPSSVRRGMNFQVSALDDLFPVPVHGRVHGSSPVTVGDAAPNSAGLETSHDQRSSVRRGMNSQVSALDDLFPVPVHGRVHGSSPVTVGDAAPNSTGLETSHDQRSSVRRGMNSQVSAVDRFHDGVSVPVPGLGCGSSPAIAGDIAPNSKGFDASHDQQSSVLGGMNSPVSAVGDFGVAGSFRVPGLGRGSSPVIPHGTSFGEGIIVRGAMNTVVPDSGPASSSVNAGLTVGNSGGVNIPVSVSVPLASPASSSVNAGVTVGNSGGENIQVSDSENPISEDTDLSARELCVEVFNNLNSNSEFADCINGVIPLAQLIFIDKALEHRRSWIKSIHSLLPNFHEDEYKRIAAARSYLESRMNVKQRLALELQGNFILQLGNMEAPFKAAASSSKGKRKGYAGSASRKAADSVGQKAAVPQWTDERLKDFLEAFEEQLPDHANFSWKAVGARRKSLDGITDSRLRKLFAKMKNGSGFGGLTEDEKNGFPDLKTLYFSKVGR